MALRPELRDELLKLPADERQVARRVQEIADGKVHLHDADEMHDELRAELRSLRKESSGTTRRRAPSCAPQSTWARGAA